MGGIPGPAMGAPGCQPGGGPPGMRGGALGWPGWSCMGIMGFMVGGTMGGPPGTMPAGPCMGPGGPGPMVGGMLFCCCLTRYSSMSSACSFCCLRTWKTLFWINCI